MMCADGVVDHGRDNLRAVGAGGGGACAILLLLINLFNYIDRYVLAVVLPRIKTDMLGGDPRSDTKLGWLATAFLVSYMITSPSTSAGWLIDSRDGYSWGWV